MKLSEGQLKFFADFIQKNLGILYLPQNYYQLESRIEEIAKILQLGSSEEVYQKAQHGITGNFKQVLLDRATNNETSFFRDLAIFQAIEQEILPSILKITPKKSRYRIWSAASSFGQEPYSLAMLAHEFGLKYPEAPPIEILSTDVSDQALNRAREGRYSQLEVQRGLSALRLVKYFQKSEENEWLLQAELKNRVRFQKQNLLEPFGSLGTFDLVLCRYVLIYQSDEKKREIISRIGKALTPGGILIMGGTESMIGLSQEFEQLSHGNALYYRKKSE